MGKCPQLLAANVFGCPDASSRHSSFIHDNYGQRRQSMALTIDVYRIKKICKRESGNSDQIADYLVAEDLAILGCPTEKRPYLRCSLVCVHDRFSHGLPPSGN